MFDEAETSSDVERNLDFRVKGLAPCAEFSRGFAGMWVDKSVEVLYNVDRNGLCGLEIF